MRSPREPHLAGSALHMSMWKSSEPLLRRRSLAISSRPTIATRSRPDDREACETPPEKMDTYLERMLRRTEPARRSSQRAGDQVGYSESTRGHISTVTDTNSEGWRRCTRAEGTLSMRTVPFARVVGKARVEADEAETKLTRGWTSNGYDVVYHSPSATEMNIGTAWA